jgi:DNA-binding response OmpR family regulator
MLSMANHQVSVLLIEDDAGIARVIQAGLAGSGFDVRWARSSSAGMTLIAAETYSAIVLDVMLPDGDGFTLCRQLRDRGIDMPIIMLTARDTLDDKLSGFRSGADDYLTKPFAIDELAMRLQALCRRSSVTSNAPTDEIVIGDLIIRPPARALYVQDRLVSLTRREFDVLLCLALSASKVVSRQQLLHSAWHDDHQINLNTVDVYISYLRKKLMQAGSVVDINTVRGIGFKLL